MSTPIENSPYSPGEVEKPANFPEYAPDVPPTTLSLFLYGEDERSSELLTEAERYWIEAGSLERIAGRIRTIVDTTTEKHNSVMADMAHTAGKVASKKTLGNAYLTMHQELSTQGTSDTEILSFFNKCVSTHLQYFGGETGRYHEKPDALQQLKNEAKTAQVPSWFMGDERAWQRFFTDHVLFDEYITKRGTVMRGLPPNTYAKDQYFRNAFRGIRIDQDTFQEWLEHTKDTIPDIAEVESEYMQQVKQFVDIYTEMGNLDERRGQQVATGLDTIKDIFTYLTGKKEQIAVQATDLGSFVTLLHAIEGTSYGFAIDSSAVQLLSPEGIINRIMDSQRIIEQTIKQTVAEFPSGLLKDMLAIWFEQQLVRTNTIGSTREPMGANSEIIFSSLLMDAHHNKVTLQKNATQIDKDTSKAYSRLLTTVRPFLAQLTQEDIEDVERFLEITKGKPVEWFVLYLANQIGDHAESFTQEKKDKKTKDAVEDLKKFSTRWITDNWQWTYAQLRSHLGKKSWEKGEIPPFSQYALERDSKPSDIEEEMKQKLEHLQENI